MTDVRGELLQQIKDKAVVHGKVTLSSGLEADYYVDLRRITLDGEKIQDGAGVPYLYAYGKDELGLD